MACTAKDWVLYIIQGKWYLTTKFIEYIKERIKVEREVNVNYIKAQFEVEKWLKYIPNFIDEWCEDDE